MARAKLNNNKLDYCHEEVITIDNSQYKLMQDYCNYLGINMAQYIDTAIKCFISHTYDCPYEVDNLDINTILYWQNCIYNAINNTIAKGSIKKRESNKQIDIKFKNYMVCIANKNGNEINFENLGEQIAKSPKQAVSVWRYNNTRSDLLPNGVCENYKVVDFDELDYLPNGVYKTAYAI